MGDRLRLAAGFGSGADALGVTLFLLSFDTGFEDDTAITRRRFALDM